ncbi:hypothetical protein MFRU_007g00780 [Monilinia fructicola]|nr:hypothetical protein MFRU_007g00780 [Monilinia fructicola]
MRTHLDPQSSSIKNVELEPQLSRNDPTNPFCETSPVLTAFFIYLALFRRRKFISRTFALPLHPTPTQIATAIAQSTAAKSLERNIRAEDVACNAARYIGLVIAPPDRSIDRSMLRCFPSAKT